MNEGELQDVFGTPTVSLIRRGMKLVNMEGEDFSHQVQFDWNSLMTGGYDYYQQGITERAGRLSKRIDREELDGWT
jgi:hypothetical protein